MTVKRWMIVVAVLAAFLSRPAYLQSIARKHEMARERLGVSDLYIYLGLMAGQGEDYSDYEPRKKAAEPIHEFASYHSAMQEKYEEAARRPWLLVPADPPPPPRPSEEWLENFRHLIHDPIPVNPAPVKTGDE